MVYETHVQQLEAENSTLRDELEKVKSEKKQVEGLWKRSMTFLIQQSMSLREDSEDWSNAANAAVLCRLFEYNENCSKAFIETDLDMWNLANRMRSCWKDSYNFLQEHNTRAVDKIFVKKETGTNTAIKSYNTTDCNTTPVYVTTDFPKPRYDVGAWTDPPAVTYEMGVQTEDVSFATPKTGGDIIFAPRRHDEDILFEPSKLGFGRARGLWRKVREAVWSLKLIPPVLHIAKRRLEDVMKSTTMVSIAMLFSKFDAQQKGGLNLTDLARLMGALGILLNGTKVRKLRREIAEEVGGSHTGLVTWNDFHKVLQGLTKKRTKSIHYTNYNASPLAAATRFAQDDDDDDDVDDGISPAEKFGRKSVARQVHQVGRKSMAPRKSMAVGFASSGGPPDSGKSVVASTRSVEVEGRKSMAVGAMGRKSVRVGFAN